MWGFKMNPSNDNAPDSSGMINAEYVPPSDTAYVLAQIEQIVREESVIEALIERGRV